MTLGGAPERADCGGRIKNPYYDEWKKVEEKSRLLDIAYRRSSDALFDVNLSQEEAEIHLDELKRINAWVETYTHKYGWAIPNDEAILEIAKYPPIVEIGAGTGYWAWLLRQLGVDVLAFDKYPPDKSAAHDSGFHSGAGTWTEVLTGDESVLDSMYDQTLFLCWPPSNHPMAFETLSRFKGDTFLFVGETWPSHTTGNEDFFDLLDQEWDLEDDCSKAWIPNWPGRDDFLWVYHRRAAPPLILKSSSQLDRPDR
jgi:hypothetical protein